MIFSRRAIYWTARRAVLRRLDVVSANLAIGTASAFVLAVAVLSVAVDRDGPAHVNAGGDWSLRGALAPADQPCPMRRYAFHSG